MPSLEHGFLVETHLSRLEIVERLKDEFEKKWTSLLARESGVSRADVQTALDVFLEQLESEYVDGASVSVPRGAYTYFVSFLSKTGPQTKRMNGFYPSYENLAQRKRDALEKIELEGLHNLGCLFPETSSRWARVDVEMVPDTDPAKRFSSFCYIDLGGQLVTKKRAATLLSR